ncbi:hypothetical protein UFOVP112_409 [uncultured Caudovirales phage]|uniref:Uncharacterized protein n=1 Tax=uncultured Caudovirales phage TaxID=2100421 RepID=A0A6J5L4R9_9CAUD|nr:hypothetical protein UFOVP112_409 [uncultured Caudovirales phage]
MASNINPYNIDGTFPVAGQDNSSQGFRDNFTNTKNNFLFAQNEINDLQSKALLTSALAGQTINNDMAGAQIKRPQLLAWTQALLDHGAISTAVSFDFNAGNFQKVTTAGSINVTFENWPSSIGAGSLGYGCMRIWFVVTDANHTVTMPYDAPTSGVIIAADDIAGNTGNGIFTFDAPGNYVFDISSIDGGVTFVISDLTRNRASFRDPALYFNSEVNPTLLLNYTGPSFQTALALEAGQDIVSSRGSYNSVSIGDLSTANIATQNYNDGMSSTQGMAGYTVSSARGNIWLGNLSPVANNDFLGYFNAYTYTGTSSGNTFMGVASINFFAKGTNVAGGLGGNIMISTAKDGTGSLGDTRLVQAMGIENDQTVKMYANANVTGNLITSGARIDSGYQYLGTPSTGFSQAVTFGKSRLVIDPAATLATGTVTLPANAVDGTIISVHSTAQITALTVNSAAGVVKPAAAFQLSAGSGADFFWHAVESTWYKIR